MNDFFFGAEDTLPYAALELLGGKEQGMVRLSGEGRILRLTARAEKVLGLSALQLVFEALSPVHQQQLRETLVNQEPCTFLEKFHGTALYEVSAVPTGEGALLLLKPWEKQTAMDIWLQLQIRSWVQNIEIASRLQSEQQSDMYDTIHRQLCRIERLLDHVEFMKQSTEQRSQPVFQYNCLTDICRQAADAYMKAGGAPVEVSVPEQLFAVCDEKLLLRALLNLLTNARQATKIWLSASHRPDHTGGFEGMYIIKVEDNGTGIPLSEIEELYQGWNERISLDDMYHFSREIQPGLGLPVVRLVAEYHYGSLLYEQRKEGGAKFCFSFPDGLMAEPDMLKCAMEPDYERIIKTELSVLDAVQKENNHRNSLEG